MKVVFAIWVHSLGQIKPVLLQSSLKPVQQSDFFWLFPQTGYVNSRKRHLAVDYVGASASEDALETTNDFLRIVTTGARDALGLSYYFQCA